MTAIAKALSRATNELGRASDTPRLDAELLMAEALHIDRDKLILSPPQRDVPKRFGEMLERRKAGEPSPTSGAPASGTSSCTSNGGAIRVGQRGLIARPRAFEKTEDSANSDLGNVPERCFRRLDLCLIPASGRCSRRHGYAAAMPRSLRTG